MTNIGGDRKQRVAVGLAISTIEEVDRIRGQQPREAWLREAVEQRVIRLARATGPTTRVRTECKHLRLCADCGEWVTP